MAKKSNFKRISEDTFSTKYVGFVIKVKGNEKKTNFYLKYVDLEEEMFLFPEDCKISDDKEIIKQISRKYSKELRKAIDEYIYQYLWLKHNDELYDLAKTDVEVAKRLKSWEWAWA